MRVAVVTESFLPSANGVTTSVLRVVDHLKRRGHDALIVCPQGADTPAPDTPSAATYQGFPVLRVDDTHIGGFRAALPNARLRTILQEYQPDVMHAASPFVLGAQALWEAGRLGIPSVAIFQTDVAGFARRHKLRLTRAAWKWLTIVHNGADLTLAPSSATLNDLRKWGFERTAYWGRGVDTVTFTPGMRDHAFAHHIRDISEDRVIIGYVGRLAAEKSVERLAPLASIPGARLVVVGDGPSRHGLEKACRHTDALFLGRLDGEKLAAAYAALDIFVHTGTQETFGQTLQEAMASGVPVVAPASGGPLDIVTHGRTGLLFEADSQKKLVSAVKSLVADPASRTTMGQAGRAKVEPCSWESICDQLLEYYDCVISQHKQTLQPA